LERARPRRSAQARSPAAGLTTQALYKLEGRRNSPAERRPRPVSVDELVALAKALQCNPVHLLVPPDAGGEPCRVTPGVTAPASQVREWIRGYLVLDGDDRQLYLTEVPPDDFEELGGLLFPRRPGSRGEES